MAGWRFKYAGRDGAGFYRGKLTLVGPTDTRTRSQQILRLLIFNQTLIKNFNRNRGSTGSLGTRPRIKAPKDTF